MPNYCKLIIAGHLSKDPEVRMTNGGMQVGNSTIAYNHGKDDKKEVCFVDITLWGEQSTRFAEWFKKGDGILVEGRLRQENWEKDGQKRSKHSMVVDRFVSLKSKPDSDEAPARPARKPPQLESNTQDYGDIPFGLLLSCLPLLWML